MLDAHNSENIFRITNPNNITFVNTNNHAIHVGSTASNYVANQYKTDINVDDVKLTINTTANVTCVGNNTLVEFTIIVNNTSIVDATDVLVKDGLPSVLILSMQLKVLIHFGMSGLLIVYQLENSLH